MRLFNRTPFRPSACLVGLLATATFAFSDAAAQLGPVQQEVSAAKACYTSADFAGAEAHYNQAIVLGAKLPPATKIILYCNLGATCREEHKFEAADAAFNKAITIGVCNKLDHTPSYANTLKQYAVLLRKMHKLDAAEQMEQLAVRALNPDAAVAQSGRSPGAGHEAPPAGENFDPSTVSSKVPEGTKALSAEELMALSDKDAQNIDLARFVASTLFTRHDFANCLKYAKRVADAQPNSAPIQLLLSYCYQRLGQHEQAVAPAKRAIALSPTADSYYNLIGIYSGAGDMANHMTAMQDYVARFPDDAHTAEFKSEIKSLSRATKESEDTASGAPTAQEKQRCWKDRAPGPIKVFLVDNAKPDLVLTFRNGTSPKRPADLVQDALDTWTSASGGKITFVKAADQNSAQIVIGYAFNADPVLSENCAAGITHWQPDLQRAMIHVGLVDKEGYNLERERFFATTLHEIGHALGLEHSKGPTDVMFWQEHAVQPSGLSSMDQQRILALYGS